MQTKLAEKIQQGGNAAAIESILRKCVHCGFCNATCPTYQIRGDELDGPRGRIYQMKQYFEGASANVDMLKHLDRCLTCRSCETTCPSGVKYSQLLEFGKHAIEQELPRPIWDRMRRQLILRFINSGWFFTWSLRVGQALAWALPRRIQRVIPARQTPVARLSQTHSRRVLMLAGCVQPALTPNTNACAINLLNKLDIEVIELRQQLCCGAAASHTSAAEYGLSQAKRLIDAWWPYIETGVEAIVVTASGCGVSVKDYGRLLADDPDYAQKADRVSSLFRDPIEIVETEIDRLEPVSTAATRVAVHTPCSLQHGLGINQRIENLLTRLGYQICSVADAHLCCGSAGTYSILQPELATQLRAKKLAALSQDVPEIIATANVGCQIHLHQDSQIPVRHWLELVLNPNNLK